MDDPNRTSPGMTWSTMTSKRKTSLGGSNVKNSKQKQMKQLDCLTCLSWAGLKSKVK